MTRTWVNTWDARTSPCWSLNLIIYLQEQCWAPDPGRSPAPRVRQRPSCLSSPQKSPLVPPPRKENSALSQSRGLPPSDRRLLPCWGMVDGAEPGAPQPDCCSWTAARPRGPPGRRPAGGSAAAAGSTAPHCLLARVCGGLWKVWNPGAGVRKLGPHWGLPGSRCPRRSSSLCRVQWKTRPLLSRRRTESSSVRIQPTWTQMSLFFSYISLILKARY